MKLRQDQIGPFSMDLICSFFCQDLRVSGFMHTHIQLISFVQDKGGGTEGVIFCCVDMQGRAWVIPINLQVFCRNPGIPQNKMIGPQMRYVESLLRSSIIRVFITAFRYPHSQAKVDVVSQQSLRVSCSINISDDARHLHFRQREAHFFCKRWANKVVRSATIYQGFGLCVFEQF